MYHLKLIKGSDSYNFLKFTTNFYHNVFSELAEKPQPDAELIESLKIQMDLKSTDEVLQLRFDLPVLERLSSMINVLARIKLENDPHYEAIALKTEEQTLIQMWHKYLPQADQYFSDLKEFIHEDEWASIEHIISGDTKA